MQTMKWIEMVRLGPTAAETSSTFDSDKVSPWVDVTVSTRMHECNHSSLFAIAAAKDVLTISRILQQIDSLSTVIKDILIIATEILSQLFSNNT